MGDVLDDGVASQAIDAAFAADAAALRAAKTYFRPGRDEAVDGEVAGLDGRGLLRECGGEAVVDTILHEKTRGRDAGLSGVA